MSQHDQEDIDPPFVIGIAGPARAGKSTVAHMMHDYLFDETNPAPYYDRTSVIYSMADQLKAAIKLMFNWTEEHTDGLKKDAVDPFWGFSPRQAMQRLGTEWGRGLRDDLWVAIMHKRVEKSPARFVIIPDVRFENEADFVRMNGVLFHIDPGDRGTEGVAAHVSEKGVRKDDKDVYVLNDKTEADLEEMIDDHMDAMIDEMRSEGYRV